MGKCGENFHRKNATSGGLFWSAFPHIPWHTRIEESYAQSNLHVMCMCFMCLVSTTPQNQRQRLLNWLMKLLYWSWPPHRHKKAVRIYKHCFPPLSDNMVACLAKVRRKRVRSLVTLALKIIGEHAENPWHLFIFFVSFQSFLPHTGCVSGTCGISRASPIARVCWPIWHLTKSAGLQQERLVL